MFRPPALQTPTLDPLRALWAWIRALEMAPQQRAHGRMRAVTRLSIIENAETLSLAQEFALRSTPQQLPELATVIERTVNVFCDQLQDQLELHVRTLDLELLRWLDPETVCLTYDEQLRAELRLRAPLNQDPLCHPHEQPLIEDEENRQIREMQRAILGQQYRPMLRRLLRLQLRAGLGPLLSRLYLVLSRSLPIPALHRALCATLQRRFPESFASAEEVAALPFKVALRQGTAQLYLRSRISPYGATLFRLIERQLHDSEEREKLKSFRARIAKDLAETYLYGGATLDQELRTALDRLEQLWEPRVPMMLFEKLRGQPATALTLALSERLGRMLAAGPIQWLQEVELQLSGATRALFAAAQDPQSALRSALSAADGHELLRHLSAPESSALAGYLWLRAPRPIKRPSKNTRSLSQECQTILSRLAREQPQVVTRLFFELDPELWEGNLSTLLPQTLEEMGRWEPLMLALLHRKIPALTPQLEAQFLSALKSQRLAQSNTGRRSLLLELLLINSHPEGVELLSWLLSACRGGRRDGVRLRRLLEQSRSLHTQGLSPLQYLTERSTQHSPAPTLAVLEERLNSAACQWLEQLFQLPSGRLSLSPELASGLLRPLLSLYEQSRSDFRLQRAVQLLLFQLSQGSLEAFRMVEGRRRLPALLQLDDRRWARWCQLEQSGLGGEIELIETKDPLALVNLGVQPIETCLSWRGGGHRRCLLSYLLEAQNRLILIRRAGDMIGRRILRLSLIWHDTGSTPEPALLVEPAYVRGDPAAADPLTVQMLAKRASELGLPLIWNLQEVKQRPTLRRQLRERADARGGLFMITRLRVTLFAGLAGYDLSDALTVRTLGTDLSPEAEVVYLRIPGAH